MLTGKSAFIGDDVSLTLSKILQREAEWAVLPAATPPRVVEVLHRCLKKDPRERLRDIGEARIALEAEQHAPAGEPPAALPPRDSHRRVPLAAAVAAVVLVIAAAAAFVWMRRDGTTGSSSAVVRVAITLPPGQQISSSITWLPLAMAPDGSRLAYVSDGRLFLRRMDSMEIQPTLGTEGAWAPFFSPDSQWVGFFAQGQLKKISVAGGVAQRVCDAAVPAGAIWAPDGTIYFAPSNGSGLSKVPAAGGTPAPFTTLDRANGEVSHRSPQVLPDGSAVLFTVWRGPGFAEMDLNLQIVGTGERRRLISGASTGRYVPSGHIVFSHGGEMSAVRFDVRRLEVSGAPVPLGITVLQGEASYYDVSRDGVLVYVPGPRQFDHRLLWVTREGKLDPLPLPPRAYEGVAVSPDGTKLALTISGPTWGVWIADVARNTLAPLTAGLESSQWAVWTADGKRVIYRGGTRKGSRNVYSKSADGSGVEERLTTSENLQTPESVSPDGKWLVFDEVHPQTGLDIWVLSLAEKGPPQVRVQTPAFEGRAKFSRDGRWIAYASEDSGRMEIYVESFLNSAGRVPVSTQGGTVPVWSRNGRALYYLSGGNMMVSEFSATPAPRFGVPRRLFSMGASMDSLAAYDVSADDSRFVLMQRVQETHSELHVVVNWFEELKRKVPN